LALLECGYFPDAILYIQSGETAMTERFNIIIASENGNIHTFLVSRKKLLLTAVLSTLALTALAFSSLFTVGFSIHNTSLILKMAVMKKDMAETNRINADFEARLGRIVESNTTEVAKLKAKNEQLVTNLQLKSSHLIADLKMQNLKQEAAFKEEKEKLVSTAVSELQERSELIANVMNRIGVKLKKLRHAETVKHSGGPFIAIEDTRFNQLLNKADQYLETIRMLPLGTPASGDISSPYGPRIDPIVHTAAFHSGLDIEGDIGDEVRATADGKVISAEKNGGYGNFILIDHGNGYTSGYGHLLKFRVKEGDRVTRGQVIGFIGNTGRSTGSHLHYEISVDGKTIDPYNFLKIADISRTFLTRQDK
jgi:murein DD-endopeptidase MepM/ murein hydrolase activator NlpD